MYDKSNKKFYVELLLHCNLIKFIIDYLLFNKVIRYRYIKLLCNIKIIFIIIF